MVTLTGADDSIAPEALLKLQNDFPIVEWAILFSSKRSGTCRYPSKYWLDKLFELRGELKLAAHLCGDYAKNILNGKESFLDEFGDNFSRVQINHNFLKNPIDLNNLSSIILDFPQIDFIIQQNTANRTVCRDIENEGLRNVNFLHDTSGGRGKKIDFLFMPVYEYYTGYAGGLSPENVDFEIQRINKFVVETPVWIDMESRIRSNNDTQFDLDKCRQVLQIAMPYVEEAINR